MPKLHELIAVEGNLTEQANKMRVDLAATFEKKRHLFEEKRKTYTELTEGAAPVIEEQQDIQTSVRKELEWFGRTAAKALDIDYRIDKANTSAVADVVTEDARTLLVGVPATALLQLEKRFKEIRELLTHVPTLDPAKGFERDPARGADIYKAREVRKGRTKKVNDVLVLYPATTQHPAQTKEITKDVVTGQILEQEWSSMITPAVKAELLDRCDVLLRAIRAARTRANHFDVPSIPGVGNELLGFIFEGLAS